MTAIIIPIGVSFRLWKKKYFAVKLRIFGDSRPTKAYAVIYYEICKTELNVSTGFGLRSKSH